MLSKNELAKVHASFVAAAIASGRFREDATVDMLNYALDVMTQFMDGDLRIYEDFATYTGEDDNAPA